MIRAARGVALGVAMSVVATHTWAQEPPPRRAGPAPGPTGADVPATLRESGPPITAYPAELLGLLAPPAERGPITLRPSIAISEEYDDNVFLDNRRRRWDVITRISPALTLTVNRPAYYLSAGYTLSGEVYAKETELNDAFKDQAFVATGFYRGTRGLTLTVADSFALSRSTNLVGSQGFATGQQETWSNTFTPGLVWQMTPQTTLNVTGTFGVQRFIGSDSTTSTPGSDSNTYGLLTTVDHALTARLTGSIGYGFTYLDFLGEGDNSATHIPTVGVAYLLTPTLTASVRGGPAITQLAGDTLVNPAVAARIEQVFQIGSVSLEYSRGVGVAGGFGGTTETQRISAGLTLPTWQRGLFVAFTPTYSTAKSIHRGQTSDVDVNAVTVPLAVNYQFARFASVFAEYRFFRQRTGSSSSDQVDIDQNRVRFGVQFGYPFNFE